MFAESVPDNVYDRLPWDEKIGVNIQILRSKQGLTQEELAAKIPVHPVTLCRWEQGKRPIKTNMLASIATALGVDPKVLLP